MLARAKSVFIFTVSTVGILIAARESVATSATTGNVTRSREYRSAIGATDSLWRDTTVIPYEATCPACRIVLQRSIVIGDTAGPGLLSNGVLVQRSRPGLYFVVTIPETHQVVVFDSNGAIRTVFGHRGSGPGEYRFISQILPRDSTLYIIDNSNLRLTEVSFDGEPLKEVRLPGLVHSLAAVDDSTYFINADVLTSERVGYTLHVLDQGGNLGESFGETTGTFQPPYRSERLLAQQSPSIIWVLDKRTYVLEMWNSSGELLRAMRFEPEWLEPGQEATQPDGLPYPATALRSLAVDRSGLLWVVATVPDSRWRGALTRTRPGPGGTRPGYEVTDYDRYYDTVIDVIDPNASMLVSTLRTDRYYHSFADASHLAALTEDTIGFYHLTIDSVFLTGR